MKDGFMLLLVLAQILRTQAECTVPEALLGEEKKVEDFIQTKQLCTSKPEYVINLQCQQKSDKTTINEPHSLAAAFSQLNDLYIATESKSDDKIDNATTIADSGIEDRLKNGECAVKAGDGWHVPTTEDDKGQPGSCIVIEDSKLRPLKYADLKFKLEDLVQTIMPLWHGIALNELPINTCTFDYSLVVEGDQFAPTLCTGFFRPFDGKYLNVDTKEVKVHYPVNEALTAALSAGA